MCEWLSTESREWDSDELMDIAEAIEETGKPRIPARVHIAEEIIWRVCAVRCYVDEFGIAYYDDEYEVVNTYRLG